MNQRAHAFCLAAVAVMGPAFVAGQAPSSCEAWNTTEFFQATGAADVKRCLDGGADPNARNDYGGTPLLEVAALNGDPAVVAALLEAGADLNARNRLQATPLHLAVELIGNPVLVAELAGAAELSGNPAVVERTQVRIPVKVITDSGLNVIIESGQCDDRSERSDAGVGL